MSRMTYSESDGKEQKIAIGGASHGKSRDGEAEEVANSVGCESVAQGGTRSNNR